MSAKRQSNTPHEVIGIYDRLINLIPDLERKGVKMPYTSVNGNMFSFVDQDNHLSLRLPEKDREEFITKYHSSLSVQYGIIMNEYVLIPEGLFSDLPTLEIFFKISYDYVAGLKPKTPKNR